jgi:hypothetical protein
MTCIRHILEDHTLLTLWVCIFQQLVLMCHAYTRGKQKWESGYILLEQESTTWFDLFPKLCLFSVVTICFWPIVFCLLGWFLCFILHSSKASHVIIKMWQPFSSKFKQHPYTGNSSYRGCWGQGQYLHCKLPIFFIREVDICLILESVLLCDG